MHRTVPAARMSQQAPVRDNALFAEATGAPPLPKSRLCTQPSLGPTREATTVTAPAPFKDGEGERRVHATNAEACNLAAEPLH